MWTAAFSRKAEEFDADPDPGTSMLLAVLMTYSIASLAEFRSESESESECGRLLARAAAHTSWGASMQCRTSLTSSVTRSALAGARSVAGGGGKLLRERNQPRATDTV